MQADQIARVLECDAQTVRGWRRIYRKTGSVDALIASRPSGAKRKLTDSQRSELLELLKHPPRQHGFDAWLWNTKLIAQLLWQKFGVEHHHDHVGALLREMGWSYQQPMRRARERDEAAIAHWREIVWPELEKKVEPLAASSSSPTKSDS